MTRKKQYIDSETYRKMLVRDGERRFREWHTAFLNYQREYLQKTAQTRYVSTADASDETYSEPKDPFGVFS